MPRTQRHSFIVLLSICLSSSIGTGREPVTRGQGSSNVIRVETITLKAPDGMEVTADEYIVSDSHPYILLLHEQQSSRGEFTSIARRLCKLDYNCLAVDLRNGGNKNYISNQTARKCREIRCPTDVQDIALDVIAAVEYAYQKSGQPVILLGSGANASLSLLIGAKNEYVRAVVAFSPGEYFQPQIFVEDTIRGLKKPVFITSSRMETPYVIQLSSGLEENYLTLFEPELGEGARGTVTLTKENPHNSEYWLALLLFFKELI